MTEGSGDTATLFPLPSAATTTEPKVKCPTHPVWTENKAKLIERYLYYFVLVTKHGTYIDAFAGPQNPEMLDTWAAKLVLDSEPRWLRNFYLCDVGAEQVARLEELRRVQPAKPRRNIRVLVGDCNVTIPQLLESGAIRQKEATFCLLDQRTFECAWSTVQALARYKGAGPKIEMFYFFANGWFDRALAAVKEGGGGAKKVEAWWGKSNWRTLRGRRPRERAHAMAERFRSELGYASAKPWAIYSQQDGGKIMYYMIHATDYPDAPALMARAYERAVQPKEPQEQLLLEFRGHGGVVKL